MNNPSLLASLNMAGLCQLAADQVNNLFADDQPVPADGLRDSARLALLRLEHCFSKIENKYFFDGKHVVFDHLHGDQYAMWLYMLSNQLLRDRTPPHWRKKLFLLNKSLHGCDIYFEVEMPAVFLLVHPLGTVLGRAEYADYFIAYQRCTIGSNYDAYPRLGRHVTLRPGSSVLGRCLLGDNVTLAAESLLLDRDLPENTTYIGNPRDFATLPRTTTERIWRT